MRKVQKVYIEWLWDRLVLAFKLVLISTHIRLILVRQSLAFCKFTGQCMDLISLLNFLLWYCRSPCSTTNTFSLLQLVWFFTEKNFNRCVFSVKCKYKSARVILYFNFSTNSSHFFYCMTFIFTMQCNSRWNMSNHQAEQRKNKNWSILMPSQDITLMLCLVISSRGVLVSGSFKNVNKFF